MMTWGLSFRSLSLKEISWLYVRNISKSCWKFQKTDIYLFQFFLGLIGLFFSLFDAHSIRRQHHIYRVSIFFRSFCRMVQVTDLHRKTEKTRLRTSVIFVFLLIYFLLYLIWFCYGVRRHLYSFGYFMFTSLPVVHMRTGIWEIVDDLFFTYLVYLWSVIVVQLLSVYSSDLTYLF